MKYPLTTGQEILRSLKCWLVGHETKTSWRPDPEYYKEPYLSDYHLVPYGKRQRTGNGFYKFHAWWKVKCKVCRSTNRDSCGLPDSLHIRLFNSIRESWWIFKTSLIIGLKYSTGYRKLFVPLYAIVDMMFSSLAKQYFVNHKFKTTFLVVDWVKSNFEDFIFDH